MQKNVLYILLFVLPFAAFASGPRTAGKPLYKTAKPNPPGGNESFSAVYDGSKVLLSWNTGNEKKFDYFTIEKAKDGIHFSTALMIKGTGGYAGLLDYREVDYTPYTGVSYYRLKKTDHQGNVSYSAVFPVNFQYGKDGAVLPANGKLPDQETLKKLEKKEVLVLVRDASGNEYTVKVKVTREQDQALYAQDSMNSLGKGAYLVLASSVNALYSQRLIVR